MAGSFPLVKGTRLRATKTNGCGMPLAGPRNRLVTKGWVSLTLTAVNREAEDIEQTNAEGRVCYEDRTPPERKWYTPALELCGVDPDLITMFTGWENILDHNDLPVGFRDQREIESEAGIALEIWTSGKSEDDCGELPTKDNIFSLPGTGRKYGYFLFAGTEWTLGDITIGSTLATLTLTGRTIAIPHWGRGPYNVAAIDDNNTPGRLLVPTSKKEHLTVFRTPIAPPEPTNGAAALATTALFTGTNYYYGGPANEAAIDVAPEQGTATSYTLGISNAGGAATGGDFKVTVNGEGPATIAYNATPANVKTALAGIDDGHLAAEYTTSGSNLPAGPVNIATTFDADIEIVDNDLTGPGAPYTINLVAT